MKTTGKEWLKRKENMDDDGKNVTIERRLDFEQGQVSTQIHRPRSSTKKK